MRYLRATERQDSASDACVETHIYVKIFNMLKWVLIGTVLPIENNNQATYSEL